MKVNIVGNKAKRLSNGGNKKAKHAKFSEKRTFPIPWYVHASDDNMLMWKTTTLAEKQLLGGAL